MRNTLRKASDGTYVRVQRSVDQKSSESYGPKLRPLERFNAPSVVKHWQSCRTGTHSVAHVDGRNATLLQIAAYLRIRMTLEQAAG